MKAGVVATLMLVAGGLAACSRSEPVAAPEPALTPARAFDQTIVSPARDTLTGADSTSIAATVFIPAHRPGERYPLVLHSHGWGGNRIDATDAETRNRDADTSTLYSRVIDLEVKQLWDAGYAVISFDQRGINQSGGQVRVMDPAYETRDAMAILDWAEQNLDLSRSADGDPRVGTIGGSYGGGFQLMLAALDPRVDVITPSATWYDLDEALVDGDVLDKAWLTGLCLVAKTDQRRLDPVVQLACEEGADTAATRFREDLRVSGADITRYFREHSLAAFARRHDDPDDSYRMRPVDALFVQGMRDTLFPFNQAWQGYRFLQGLGGDVRLLTNQHGHVLPAPFSQNAALGSIGCGSLDTIVAIRAFLDAKLRDRSAGLAAIPEVCLSLDDETAVNLETVPVGGNDVVQLDAVAVTAQDSNLAGGGGPRFIPLAAPVAGEGWLLAGVPTASLRVSPGMPGTVGVAFVAVGIQRGDAAPFPVDYQVKPLRSDRDHADITLYGIAERLQPGDRVGVLVYGNFDEFEVGGQGANYRGNQAVVSGEVRLPLLRQP